MTRRKYAASGKSERPTLEGRRTAHRDSTVLGRRCCGEDWAMPAKHLCEALAAVAELTARDT